MRDRIINRNVMKQIFTFVFLFCSSLFAGAQNSYFVLDDYDDAILVGLTPKGKSLTAITIPATVSKVKSNAFESALVEELKIEGNPKFEANWYGVRESESDYKLRSVDMGSNMTATNMLTMLESLGKRGNLEEVLIEGFADAGIPNIDWTCPILTNEVHVKLSPHLVTDDQVFGAAQVMGRFHLTSEIITFCGNASFVDADDGSHWLFYIPTAKQVYEGEGDDKGKEMIYIQRVRVIPAGQGVLIHNISSTAQYADLQRNDRVAAEKSYEQNMLKGVVKDTDIEATDGDKTNLILYNGSFYPTSSGTFPAFKAYLQIPTESWNKAALARWTPRFDDETTAIDALQTDAAATSEDGPMYNMAGQRVANNYKGLIIQNGKKKIVK